MSQVILELIPQHKIYVEPFAGGAAVYWYKDRSQKEILNDLDFDLINFYKCVKYYAYELEFIIKSIHYNRVTLKNGYDLMKCPHNTDFINITRAAVFWYCQNSSYNGTGTSGYSSRADNKKDYINYDYQNRLSDTDIFCTNAIDVIIAYDSPDTLFYLDPPYFNASQCYYANLTKDDYINLLDILTNIKGKFILSGYPSFLLHQYSQLFKWKTARFEMPLSSCLGVGIMRNKVEELTTNF